MPSTPTEPPVGTPQPGKFGGDSVCVLWHHPEVAPPAELVSSLGRHGATVVLSGSAYGAMAQACRVSRDPSEPRAVLLLLVEPAALPGPGAAAFVRAARRYAPRSACWWFSSTQNPAFRAVMPQDLAAWSAEREGGQEAAVESAPARGVSRDGSPQVVRGGSPKLRLAGEDVGAASPHVEPKSASAGESGGLHLTGPGVSMPARPDVPREALTAEELAMLLGDPELPPGVSGGGGREAKRQ